MTGAVLVCVGQTPLSEASPVSSIASMSAIASAASADSTARDTQDHAIAALEEEITEAKAVVDASSGRVLDESVRENLLERIEEGRQAVRAVQLLAAIAAPGTAPVQSAIDVADERALAERLDADAAVVQQAVAAWEAEQARIAAEQEAARRAAEAAAAAARAHPRASGARVSAAPGPYVEGIWTSGGQAQIDACRGSVNMPDVAGYLGGSFYAAEHWSCGGRTWAGIGTGALVSFPGYGVYQVAGRVGGLPSGSSASSVPSGYDGYYQTCMNGDVNNLTVWLLTRVG